MKNQWQQFGNTSNFNPVQWIDSIKTLSNISLLIIFYINFKLLSKE
jgi:hypothetical protein